MRAEFYFMAANDDKIRFFFNFRNLRLLFRLCPSYDMQAPPPHSSKVTINYNFFSLKCNESQGTPENLSAASNVETNHNL